MEKYKESAQKRKQDLFSRQEYIIYLYLCTRIKNIT